MTGSGAPTGSEEWLRRLLWRALALVTGIVVATAAGAGFVDGLVLQRSTDTYTASRPVTALEIDNSGGSVEVDAGPPGQVRVQRTLGWVLGKPTVDRSWSHGVLKITVFCPGRQPDALLGCQVDVRIRVPAGTPVQSTATSGATSIVGMSGSVDLRANSASTSLDGVSGPVTVESTSGPIQGDRLRSGQLHAGSTSGPVMLTFAAAPGDVTVDSTSGPIDISLPRGARYRAVASSHGPTSIDDGLADPQASGSVKATSESGPVDIAYPS